MQWICKDLMDKTIALSVPRCSKLSPSSMALLLSHGPKLCPRSIGRSDDPLGFHASYIKPPWSCCLCTYRIQKLWPQVRSRMNCSVNHTIFVAGFAGPCFDGLMAGSHQRLTSNTKRNGLGMSITQFINSTRFLSPGWTPYTR